MTGIDFQTSTEGIFAAGDVHAGSTKQLASAAREGAAAQHLPSVNTCVATMRVQWKPP